MKRISLLAALLLIPAAASAQSFIRLQTDYKPGTISANGGSIVMSAEKVGGFGSVKIQTLDSYSGTWELQCSLNGTAFDAGSELKLIPTDSTTTAYSVTDAIGVWDVPNAGGCRAIRVIATAGFAASDVAIVISATQAGGGGGGGGDVTLGDVTLDLTSTNAILTNILGATDGLEANTAGLLTAAIFNAALGTAGTADTQVLSVQGIASMTPILATVSDGAGALNVIVDSGAITATVTDGSGALNVIIDSSATLTVSDGSGALNVICDSGCSGGTQYAEDAAHVSTNIGTMALAVRQDSQVDFAADGDYVPLSIDGDGGLRVSIIAGAGSGGTALADDADFTAGTTSFTPAGGFYQSTVTACTDGDTCAVGITTGRAMKVFISAADGTAQTVATDMTVGSAFGTTGPGRLGLYQDFDGAALATPTNVDTELEAVPLSASIKGVQYVMVVSEDGSLERGTATTPYIVGDGSGALNVICDSGCSGGTQYAEDSQHATTNLGTMALVVRNDANTALAADLDYIPLTVNSVGSLWVDTHLAINEDQGESSGVGGVVPLSVRRNVAAASTATDAEYATTNTDALGLLWSRHLDPCTGIAKTHIPISIATATTTELTAALAGASTNYYVCSIDLVTAGANNVALVDDDTDNCASVTSGLAGGTTAATGWNFAANGGLAKGNGEGTVFKTNGTNRVMCLVTSAAVQLSGSIQVVAAP